MRIWDLPVQNLCRKHLLGEHRELHCIWTFITTDKGGSYKKHPETLRWINYLPALWARHYQQDVEMTKRGYKHGSPIIYPQQPSPDYIGSIAFPPPINTRTEQIERIKAKNCECKI